MGRAPPHLQDTTVTVSLSKPMGLVLADSSNGVLVEEVQPGLAAETRGMVNIGDRVLAVCGQDVSSLDLKTVMQHVGAAPANLTLTLSRSPTSSPSPLGSALVPSLPSVSTAEPSPQ